jgi:hypothetical protein
VYTSSLAPATALKAPPTAKRRILDENNKNVENQLAAVRCRFVKTVSAVTYGQKVPY